MARYEAPELARQASRNTLSLISCVTKIATVGTDLTLHQFSRSKVERVDFSHFLSLYAL